MPREAHPRRIRLVIPWRGTVVAIAAAGAVLVVALALAADAARPWQRGARVQLATPTT